MPDTKRTRPMDQLVGFSSFPGTGQNPIDGYDEHQIQLTIDGDDAGGQLYAHTRLTDQKHSIPKRTAVIVDLLRTFADELEKRIVNQDVGK